MPIVTFGVLAAGASNRKATRNMLIAGDGEGAYPGAVAAGRDAVIGRRCQSTPGLTANSARSHLSAGLLPVGRYSSRLVPQSRAAASVMWLRKLSSMARGGMVSSGLCGVGAAGGGHGGGELGQAAGVVFAIEDGLPAGFVVQLWSSGFRPGWGVVFAGPGFRGRS